MFRHNTLLPVAGIILALIIHPVINRTSVFLTELSSGPTRFPGGYSKGGYATRRGDTTAIILNWSRLSNVVKIASVLCQPQLDETIAQVFIWNNSPQKVDHATFLEAKCPKSKLRLYNSPSNLYFQARFFACEQAETPYCFIQDDDYLVWPEVISAMRSRMSEKSTSAIHLTPPYEILSSRLRTITVVPNIHTSFAWLGYGTLLPRKMAIDFLSLLRRVNATEDVMKMADNYFTILMNSAPEVWFDQGVELGGGRPFTVGSEGDERNKMHIEKAARMLDSLPLNDPSEQRLGNDALSMVQTTVDRAPCVGRMCIFETSIPLLPPNITNEVPKAVEILEKEGILHRLLSDEYKQNYVKHPPSHAVDGRNDTCFQSPTNARVGDWISLDPVNRASRSLVVMNLIVDEATEDILLYSTMEAEIESWVALEKQLITCESQGENGLRLCNVPFRAEELDGVARRYRLRLSQSLERRWRICEIWISGV